MPDIFGISRKGDREINEDAIGIYKKGKEMCAVVADGLGGHGKGEMASAAAVDVCGSLFQERGWKEDFFQEYFRLCEERLEQKQKEEYSPDGIKTTVVLAGVQGDKVKCAHVGDSRMYYFRRNRILYRTLDHSVPQMLVFAREIKEKQIRRHPDRNKLLKVMGQKMEQIYFEVQKDVKWKNGDAVLLCTDGFWELIEEKKMRSILKKIHTAQEWIHLMEEVVLEKGKGQEMDNYSAIAILF